MATISNEEAKKLNEKIEKKKTELVKKLKVDIKSLVFLTNKKDIDYGKVCKLSQIIYENSETITKLK